MPDAHTILLRLKQLARWLREPLFVVPDAVRRLHARRFRRGPYLRARFAGLDPNPASARAAVYVHYDKDGVVHDYVVHQLRELSASGFRTTFISNAPVLPQAGRDRVAPFCREVIWRHNVGYDFGAYKDGLAAIGAVAGLDALLLMNDSVYGPFWSLKETLASVDETRCDVWGIADSWQRRPHVQSFFLLFLAKALQSEAFDDFWSELDYIDHKQWVIRNAEVRLSRVLAAAGLRQAVLAPYGSVHDRAKARILTARPEDYSARIRRLVLNDQALNPMQYFWDILITDYRCPFIKKDLLSRNLADVPHTDTWPAVIGGVSSYDIGLIERHLKAQSTAASLNAADA